MTLQYSDIDPNVIELLARQLETPLERLIEEKIQRRQQWGPTFKQEDIAELSMTDADFIVPAPEYGKRVLRMAGLALTAPRVVRVPPIPSAWWIVHNRTSQALQFLTDPAGTIGPTIAPDALGGIYTDGIGVWQFACCGEVADGGEEMPPGGGGTNIQYRLNATTFGGVGGSSVSGVSGENVLWHGTHAMSKAGNRSNEWFIDPAIVGTQTTLTGRQYGDTDVGATIVLERGRGSFLSASILQNTNTVGVISFTGQTAAPPAPPTQLGYLKTQYFDATSQIGIGGIVTIGARAAGEARIEIGQGATASYVQLYAGIHHWQVQSGGFHISAGLKGALFYKGADVTTPGTGYFIPLVIGGEGDVLKVVSGLPKWEALAGASFPRLDQIVSPAGGNAAFSMLNYQVSFQFAGADVEDNFVIESVDSAAGSGVVLLVRTGTSSPKAPFRVGVGGAAGPTVFGVNSLGKVAAGSIASSFNTDGAYNFNVFGLTRLVCDNTSPAGSPLRVEQVSNTANGETAVYVTSTQTGVLSGLGLYSDVFMFSDVKGSGTVGDARGVVSSMQYSGTITQPQLRGFVAFVVGVNPIPANSTYTAFFAPNWPVSQTHGGIWRGVYLQKPSDTWANYYGVIAESGLLSGFGTNGPTASLHAAGTVRFDLGSDAQGDIYYRAPTTGLLTRLATPGGGAPAGAGLVLTLAVVGSGLEPRWMAGGTTGPGSPGLPVGSLQYNNAGTGFLGVTDSSVAGAAVTLGGALTIQNGLAPTKSFVVDPVTSDLTLVAAQSVNSIEPITQVFRRTRTGSTNTGDGDYIGRIIFEGRVATAPKQLGYLQTYMDSAPVNYGATVELGAGAFTETAALLRATHNGSIGSAGLYAAAHYFQVQTFGHVISGGGTGSIWYKSAPSAGSYYVPLDIDADPSGGGTDVDKVLTVVDTGGGVLLPQWRTPSITGTAAAAGNNLSLQYNNGGVLGGIPGVKVVAAAAPNLMASGYLQLVANWTEPPIPGVIDIDQEFFISARKSTADGSIAGFTAGTIYPARFFMRTFRDDNIPPFIRFERARGTQGSKGLLSTGDTAGRLEFYGYITSTTVPTQMAFLESYYQSGLGTVARLAARAGTARLEIQDNGSGIYSTTIKASDSHWVQVQQGGIRLSVGDGLAGALLHQTSGLSGLAALPLPSAGADPGQTFVLRHNGSAPYWGVSPGGSVTITPPVVLTYTNTTTSDIPTLIVDHTLQTSGTITSSYGMKIYFRHRHNGGVVSTSTSQRVGVALVWDHTTAGTGGESNKGDSCLQIYAQNNPGMSTATYKLNGITVETGFAVQVGNFTAIKIKAALATTRRAIAVLNGGGDIMLNAPNEDTGIGVDLVNTTTHGFLYIPTMSGPPNASAMSGLIPVGTCALVWDRTNNQLYANDGGGWLKTVAFT